MDLVRLQEQRWAAAASTKAKGHVGDVQEATSTMTPADSLPVMLKALHTLESAATGTPSLHIDIFRTHTTDDRMME